MQSENMGKDCDFAKTNIIVNKAIYVHAILMFHKINPACNVAMQ